jgi:REP element-mobilizing transposase RayT
MARKHHVQVAIEFPAGHGGKREGAGRKRGPGRRREPHVKRPTLLGRFPVHVVIRVADDVGELRTRDAYHAIRRALYASLERDNFRVVHLSIQRRHVHLVVEASDEKALANGMRALQISAARQLNQAVTIETGIERKGRVFVDRYHARILKTPHEVRNAIGYVLNNWRHHGEHRRAPARRVDPYSSGVNFGGWKELDDSPFLYAVPDGFSRLSTSLPHTWLLRVGWMKTPPVSVFDVPGPEAETR